MKRLLGFAGIALIAIAGCRSDGGTTADFSKLPDLSNVTPPDFFGMTVDLCCQQSGGDMAAPTPDFAGGGPMTVTIHDIDTGVVAANTAVTVQNAVVVGVANNAGHSKTSMKCEYKAWFEDGSGAPDGIYLFVTGSTCTQKTFDDGTSACTCPYPPNSGTILDQVSTLGDVFTIVGTTGSFSPSTDMGLLPPQHEIDNSKTLQIQLTKTGSGMPVMSTVISDAATIATFAKNGTGYQMYEGMVVTIQPSAAAMTSTPDMYNGFTYAGALFSGDYGFAWDKTVTLPGNFTSITGIAEPAFGGGIAPRQPSDFVQ